MSRRFVLAPIRHPKPSRAIADLLREAILTGELADGELLPSERDLAVQADVSRGSIREALRALEAERLIEIRGGRNGGAVIRVPGAESLSRPVAAFIRGAGLDDRPLVETLLVIEPAVAAIAAQKRTADDLAALVELTDQLEERPDHTDLVTLNTQWHLRLGEATHNALLAGIVNGLRQAIEAATEVEAFAGPGVHERAVVSFRRVVAAVEAGNAPAAHAAMHRHISAAAQISAEFRAAMATPGV